MSDFQLLLSGFADEASESKAVAEQFAVMSALGLKYLSLRFVDAGNGIKNALQLDQNEIGFVNSELERYGLQVSSLGSPIGKVKLFDFDDGSDNQFVDFDEYLETQVEKACLLATKLGTKLIRGFSFYHPRGDDPDQYISDAAEKLKVIAQTCDAHELTFGLEVEANLIGQNAEHLLKLHNQVNHEALVLIFDGANLVTQGYNSHEVIEQFKMMLPALGWLHIKDYVGQPETSKSQYVDEESLNQFVPAGSGESDYATILKVLAENYQSVQTRLRKRGIGGIYADLEPHLKQGGQFGGFSGPDGFGIAARAFVDLCHQVNVRCDVASFDDMNR